jgi:large subunit ribosomal protein L28
MTRRCMVTGKGPLVGNKVSHANNKTKRRFMPGVKTTKLYSETLGRMVSLKITTHGIRSVEHKGGLDAYLTGTAPSKLDESLRPVRAEIKAKLGDVKKPVAKKAPVKAKQSVRAAKASAANKAKAPKKAAAK